MSDGPQSAPGCKKAAGRPAAFAVPKNCSSSGGFAARMRRQRHGLIGGIQELDGHEYHLLVPEIFEVMHLELPGAVSLVSGLARLIGIFDGRAIVHMLAPAPARDRGPEIIQHMAMEPDPFARLQADFPNPDPLILGQ